MTETYHQTRRFPIQLWIVCEKQFDPADYLLMEGILALSNGYMGQRCSFEEGLGEVASLRGNYIAGVFDSYPNATMIKLKGRPANPSEMVNVPDYLPVSITLDGEKLDLSTCMVNTFERTLHMDRGVLTREVNCETPKGKKVRLSFTRFLSRPRKHLAAMRIEVTPLNFSGEITFASQINGAVKNVNHQHLHNVTLCRDSATGAHGLCCATINSDIEIAMLSVEKVAGTDASSEVVQAEGTAVSTNFYTVPCVPGKSITFDKLVAVTTSRDLDLHGHALASCSAFLHSGVTAGFETLLQEQLAAWAQLWQEVDIDVRDKSGTDELTQGLQYSLYQMLQNAPNQDYTVNIGAKGMTGEHYFGTYFWDTEVYMLPMFGFIQPEVAKNLVKSRVFMLPGAREKARELDLQGAAFPFMSDADGRESSTLWQFSLMGIHVTAAVAWGVWFYYCTSGDLKFVAENGIDLMVETSRCWLSRVFYRQDSDKYVINRVLGPDEYHQGVDNNYYTNIMVQENLLKTVELLQILREQDPKGYSAARERLFLHDDEEASFQHVADRIYFPRDEKLQINLQDDTFLMLEPYDLQAKPLTAALNQIWSYDRLMRTQLLRQGDLVVAHLLLGNRFTRDDIARDFAFTNQKQHTILHLVSVSTVSLPRNWDSPKWRTTIFCVLRGLISMIFMEIPGWAFIPPVWPAPGNAWSSASAACAGTMEN